MTKILKILVFVLFVFGSSNLFAIQSYNVPQSKIEISNTSHELKIVNFLQSEPPKSLIFTFFLALFFGLLGLHRVYLGLGGSAIGKFILTLAFVGAIFLALAGTAVGVFLSVIVGAIVIIWHFVDIVNILNGNLKPEKGDYDI
ncbi:MAG: hypothetical protein JXR68_00020 [Bacteroidales bacterium]|nr:hypothetical protein [Bacteroidales bacterium]